MSPPDGGAPLIRRYESIATCSARMLDAARAGRWEDLVAAEADCAAEVRALRALATEESVRRNPRVNHDRISILRRVLDHDAEIRQLTQTWLRSLEHSLQYVGLDRRVRHAYSNGFAGAPAQSLPLSPR